ncbi:hypothetical protein VNI00_018054 [Paramarasmius palmivorus]|uniref:Uncharacterized protein n=1 Tax=Paramarasmius palmivorus TaxID=297713 RepID=A0AAW0B2H3_9AGAR
MAPHTGRNLRSTRIASRTRTRRRSTEDHDPDEVSLKRYQRNLDRHVSEGKMMTFNPRRRRWERWPRPYYETNDGLLGNMHADAFPLVPFQPVLCPHSLNPMRKKEDCTMTIHQKLEGTPSFYFQVQNGTHECRFLIPIPDLKEYTPPMIHCSFFTIGRALSRATHDAKVCDALESSYLRGDFQNGTTHPTQTSQTPPELLAWDLTVNPESQNVANQHQQFVGTGIGFAIRNLHSTRGISLKCMYSVDGYQDHLDGHGNCRNWFVPARPRSKLPAVERLTPEMVWDVADRPEDGSDTTSTQGEVGEEYCDNGAPTRAALLEWNSRVGITKNVWALVSTMGVLCRDCLRIRSVVAHECHYNVCINY